MDPASTDLWLPTLDPMANYLSQGAVAAAEDCHIDFTGIDATSLTSTISPVPS
jgi:hypothetical protein